MIWLIICVFSFTVKVKTVSELTEELVKKVGDMSSLIIFIVISKNSVF